MRNIFGIIAFTLFFNIPAMAGVVIEPYVGYESGTMEQTGTPSLDNTGAFYGARLGYGFGSLKFGIDYMTSAQDIEQSGDEGEYEPTDLGAFIGYGIFDSIDLYLSYFFDSKAEFPGSPIVTESFSGTALRFGIGWKCLSFMNINLESIMRTYDKYDDIDLNAELKGSSVGLSLSFPIL